MLKEKEKFVSFFEGLENISKDFGLQVGQGMADAVSRTEMLVPVVGGFSAGKSTLINSFIGENVLPVNINPETELATEIRYSPESRLVAIRHDGGEECFDVQDVASVNKKSSEYAMLKLYLNSEAVRSINPFIIVDMPGYGSSMASHNNAISYYAPKGVYFIVVSSVSEGGLTNSLIRHAREAENHGAGLFFVVSKSDLRAPESVEKVLGLVGEQVAESFAKEGYRVLSSSNSQEESVIARIFKGLDANKVFHEIYSEEARRQGRELIAQLQQAKRVVERGKSFTKDQIEDVEDALSALLKEKSRKEDEVRSKYSDRLLENCLDAVEDELESSMSELVYLSKNNLSGLDNAISGIVRSSLAINLRKEIGSIAHDILSGMKSEIKSVGIMSSVSAQRQVELEENVDRIFECLSDADSEIVMGLNCWKKKLDEENNKGQEVNEVVVNFLDLVTSLSTSAPHPAAKIALVVVPQLVKFAMRNIDAGGGEDFLRNQVFPEVRRSLRMELPSKLEAQLEAAMKSIEAAFTAKINEQKQIIDSFRLKNEADEQEKANAIARLNEAIAAIEKSVSEVSGKRV